MKKLKYVLVAVMILASVAMLSACNSAEVTYDSDASGSWTYAVNEDGSVTLMSYIGAESDVVVPTKITASDGFELDVTALGEAAFLKYDADGVYTQNIVLQTVTFEEGCQVKAIPNRAFYMCTELKSVELTGSNIESIGDFAFYGCTTLNDVVIPAKVKSIGAYAYRECPNDKKVYILKDYEDKNADGELNIPKIGAKCFYLINRNSNDKDRYYLADDFKIYVADMEDYDIAKLEEFRKNTKNDSYKYWSEYEGHIEAYFVYGGND